MKRILDAKHEKSDLEAIAESSTYLDTQERKKLHTLLKKYESLFDVNLVTWHGKTFDIKLKTYAEPHNGRNSIMSIQDLCLLKRHNPL